jgi:hypothetical protein
MGLKHQIRENEKDVAKQPAARSDAVASVPSEGLDSVSFDRNVYHRAYMREYMRRWRAKKKAAG